MKEQLLTEEALAEIEARANAATPGEWAVWDSCSWRRIGTREPFADGNVICPVTQNDGHPDLLAKREDLEFVAHARTDIPALIQTVRAAWAESEALEKFNVRLTTGLVNIYHIITGEACKHGVALGMATSAVSSLKSESAALREQLAQVEKELATAKRDLDREYRRQGGVGFRP